MCASNPCVLPVLLTLCENDRACSWAMIWARMKIANDALIASGNASWNKRTFWQYHLRQP